MEVLKDVFGLTSLRPLQQPATNAIMAGRDVLLVLPTGGGKSLCYQLPAMLSEGLSFAVYCIFIARINCASAPNIVCNHSGQQTKMKVKTGSSCCQ